MTAIKGNLNPQNFNQNINNGSGYEPLLAMLYTAIFNLFSLLSNW
jgi:hypothetical protein